MTQRWAGAAVAALGFAAIGCGLVGPGSGYPGRPIAGSGPSASPIPTVPTAAQDLEDVCENGPGFGALPPYVPGKGRHHKGVLLTKDSDSWIANSSASHYEHANWFLPDKGDPKIVDTVVCSERVNAAPAGKTCQMQDSSTKKNVKITMYNTAYRIRVRAAHTGKVLLDRQITATSRECPFMAFTISEGGENKYFTEPTEDQISPVIKPILAP